MDYGEDSNGRRVCRGAQMGRSNILSESAPAGKLKFSLRHLPFVDGDYDTGGAYWGSPANIYRAVTPDKHVWLSNWDGSIQTDKRHLEVFVRAGSRAKAKRKVLDLMPGATFYR